MDALCREILQNWQVRKSKAEKLAFIDMMRQCLPGLRVEEGGFPRCRNLVLGDAETAEVVFTAHYDTCARLPFPNVVTPKNILLYLLYNILIMLPFFALMALLAWLLVPRLGMPGFLLSLWLPLGLMLYIFIFGPANPHTVNDNTSGVLTLIEIIRSMSEEERARVCFVFFDHEESGLLGSGYFAALHKKQMKNKLLVNFDCVSDGDSFLFVQSRKARKAYEEAIKAAFAPPEGKTALFERTSTAVYPSDQANFPVGVGVAALNKHPVFGYYLSRIHTPRDTVLQEENIAFLAEGARKLASGL